MKKRIAALTAALCLLLAGCGAKSDQPYTADSVKTLLDAGIFSETLETVDKDIICALYGIEADTVTDCTAYLSTGATAEELVLFTLAEETDADTVKAACEKRVADQKAAYESYGPDEVTKLDGAVISVRENTVLLVVGSDPAAVGAAADKL